MRLMKSQKRDQDPVSFSGDQQQLDDHIMYIKQIFALFSVMAIIYFVLPSLNTLFLLIYNMNFEYEQLP